jgi:hypothetical protein
MDKVIIFVLALVVPSIYWRGLFYIASHNFNKAFTRDKTGLQVHHLHYGILFTFIANLLLLLNVNNNFVIALLGIGFGLILDEFIPSLLMPGNRPLELEVYRKSLTKTLWMFLVIVLIILLLSTAVGRL